MQNWQLPQTKSDQDAMADAISDYDRIQRGLYGIAPHTKPRQEMTPYTPNLGDIAAISDTTVAMVKIGVKVVGAVSIFAGAKLILVWAAALGTAGAASIGVILGANPGTVAGVVFGLIIAGVLACTGMGGGEDRAKTGSAGGGNTYNTYNQYIHQGPGGQQNNQNGEAK